MTLEIARDGAAEPLRYSVELSDADVDRVSVAYAAIMFPNGVVNEDGAPRAPTGAEVLAAAAQGIVKQMMDTAFQWHRKKAIRDAEAGVAPISVTPAE
jgi:hypothetical protein